MRTAGAPSINSVGIEENLAVPIRQFSNDYSRPGHQCPWGDLGGAFILFVWMGVG
jgi:hypothetical protein